MPPKASTPTLTKKRSGSNLKSPARARKSTSSSSRKRLAISQSKYVLYASYAIAGLLYIFGGLYFANPKLSLGFFELDYPLLPKQQSAIDALLLVIGIRDIAVGTILGLSLYLGTKKLSAYTLIVAGAMAFLDGAVCFIKVGKGQWNHFSYSPFLVLTGLLLSGHLDK